MLPEHERPESKPDFSARYDDLYRHGYRSRLESYEIARWEALEHYLTYVLNLSNVQSVLDYGSGSGAFVPLWQALFPRADLCFCDVSAVALEKLRQSYPQYRNRCFLVRENRTELEDGTADVILSVEVMEHVENLEAYLNDVYRLLKPGGHFVWTSPCANRLSIEHIYSALTRQIEDTPEGTRRWKWEDPTHLRRLRSDEVRARLQKLGFADIRFRFRAHFFSFICSRYLAQRLPEQVNEKLMKLDYRLFRRLPNGASMLGSAIRPGAG